MKHIQFLATLALFLIPALSFAQRIRVVSGDLSVLNNIRNMNVQYDYSNMDVGNKTEKEYVDEKRNAYNKREDGRGDKWAAEWVDDRGKRFEPAFENAFNSSSDIRIGNYPNAKYTLIFETIFTEPGFNVGVTRSNSYISADVLIVETADSNHVIAKLTCDNSPGRSFWGTDFDTGARIQEAYAAAGARLARFFRNY